MPTRGFKDNIERQTKYVPSELFKLIALLSIHMSRFEFILKIISVLKSTCMCHQKHIKTNKILIAVSERVSIDCIKKKKKASPCCFHSLAIEGNYAQYKTGTH